MKQARAHTHKRDALVGVAGLQEADEEGVRRADRHLELERREHEGLHVDDLGLFLCVVLVMDVSGGRAVV